MIYKKWPKQERIEYEEIYFAVTGEGYWSRNIKTLAPAFLTLAIAEIVRQKAKDSLRKAGLLGGKK